MMIFSDIRLLHVSLTTLLFLASTIASDADARSRGWGSKPKKTFSRSSSVLPGWYMGMTTSVNFVADSSLSERGGTSLTGTLSFNDGYGLAANTGYTFPRVSSMGAFRAEFEVGFHSNNLDALTPAGGTTQSLTGEDATLQTTMANIFFDVETKSPWRPYLGLGLGVGRLSVDSTTLNTDETEALFAYQGMAGIYYQPYSFKNVAVGVGYRYLATADAEFDTSTGSKMDVEYSSHLIELGTQIRF